MILCRDTMSIVQIYNLWCSVLQSPLATFISADSQLSLKLRNSGLHLGLPFMWSSLFTLIREKTEDITGINCFVFYFSGGTLLSCLTSVSWKLPFHIFCLFFFLLKWEVKNLFSITPYCLVAEDNIQEIFRWAL